MIRNRDVGARSGEVRPRIGSKEVLFFAGALSSIFGANIALFLLLRLSAVFPEAPGAHLSLLYLGNLLGLSAVAAGRVSFSPIRIYIGSQFVLCACAVAIGLESLGSVFIGGAAFVHGLALALAVPTRFRLLEQLGTERSKALWPMLTACMQLGLCAGPALAAAGASHFSLETIVVAALVCYLSSALLWFVIFRRESATWRASVDTQGRHFLREMSRSFKECDFDAVKWIVPVSFFFSPLLAFAPVLFKQWHGGFVAYGVAISSLGIGSTLGAVLAGNTRLQLAGSAWCSPATLSLIPLVSILPIASHWVGWGIYFVCGGVIGAITAHIPVRATRNLRSAAAHRAMGAITLLQMLANMLALFCLSFVFRLRATWPQPWVASALAAVMIVVVVFIPRRFSACR